MKELPLVPQRGKNSSCGFSSHCFGNLDAYLKGKEGQFVAKVTCKMEWGGRAAGNWTQ